MFRPRSAAHRFLSRALGMPRHPDDLRPRGYWNRPAILGLAAGIWAGSYVLLAARLTSAGPVFASLVCGLTVLGQSIATGGAIVASNRPLWLRIIVPACLPGAVGLAAIHGLGTLMDPRPADPVVFVDAFAGGLITGSLAIGGMVGPLVALAHLRKLGDGLEDRDWAMIEAGVWLAACTLTATHRLQIGLLFSGLLLALSSALVIGGTTRMLARKLWLDRARAGYFDDWQVVPRSWQDDEDCCAKGLESPEEVADGLLVMAEHDDKGPYRSVQARRAVAQVAFSGPPKRWETLLVPLLIATFSSVLWEFFALVPLAGAW